MRTIYTLLMIVSNVLYAYSTGTLQGKIYDMDTKEPLIFVAIGLYNNGKLIQYIESDLDGNYFAPGIESGHYVLIADYLGYCTNEVDFSIMDGQEVKIDMEMKKMVIELAMVILCEFRTYDHECTNNCYGEKVASSVNEIEMDDSDLVSEEYMTESSSLTLYPNPASNIIIIETKNTIEEISVLSLSGKLLIHKNPKSDITEIDISSLPHGFYIVQIEQGAKKVSKKLTKFE